MQTKQTARLAKKIRRLRDRKKRGKHVHTWKFICEKLNILTDDGRADPGLAYKIGYEEYEPSNRAMRARLGLRDICVKCKRTFRAIKPRVEKPSPSPAFSWWQKLKREEKQKLIEISYRNFMKWKKDKSFG